MTTTTHPLERIESERLAHMLWHPIIACSVFIGLALYTGALLEPLLAAAAATVTATAITAYALLKKAANLANIDATFPLALNSAFVIPWPERAATDRLKSIDTSLYAWGIAAHWAGYALIAASYLTLFTWLHH